MTTQIEYIIRILYWSCVGSPYFFNSLADLIWESIVVSCVFSVCSDIQKINQTNFTFSLPLVNNSLQIKTIKKFWYHIVLALWKKWKVLDDKIEVLSPCAKLPGEISLAPLPCPKQNCRDCQIEPEHPHTPPFTES